MAMMALPTTVQESEAAVDRRVSMGMDAEVERRMQLVMTTKQHAPLSTPA